MGCWLVVVVILPSVAAAADTDSCWWLNVARWHPRSGGTVASPVVVGSGRCPCLSVCRHASLMKGRRCPPGKRRNSWETEPAWCRPPDYIPLVGSARRPCLYLVQLEASACAADAQHAERLAPSGDRVVHSSSNLAAPRVIGSDESSLLNVFYSPSQRRPAVLA